MSTLDTMEISSIFRTIVVPMKVPTEPEDEDMFLRFLHCSEINSITSQVFEGFDGANVSKIIHEFAWLHQESNFSSTNIRKSLGNIREGSFGVFYLKAQNAVVLIHRFDCVLAHLYAWRCQISSEVVLGAVDTPVRLRVPESYTSVQWQHLVEDKVFAELLHDLGQNEQKEAVAHTQRSGCKIEEIRGTTEPMFVTEWLLLALGGQKSPESSLQETLEDKAALLKKIRDEARYGDGFLLWRRVPAWFGVKSAVNFGTRLVAAHKCTPTVDADLKYKTWIVELCRSFFSSEQRINCLRKECGDSAVLECVRKIARRVEKMKRRYDNSGLFALESGCLTSIGCAVKMLKSDWDSKANSPVECIVSLSKKCVQQGIVHHLQNSSSTLAQLYSRLQPSWSGIEKQIIGPPPAIRRFRQVDMEDHHEVDRLAEKLEDLSEDSPREALAALQDIKDNVFRTWKEGKNKQLPKSIDTLCESMLNLMKKNLQVSAKFFQGDVFMQSNQTILVSLTMLLIIDRFNCRQYDLVKDYKLAGIIGQQKFLNALCLYDVGDKCHLHELEQYIQERNSSALHDYSILDTESKPHSFANQFARHCSSDMGQVHRQIQDECRRNEAEKIQERKREKARYDALELEMCSLYCRCYQDRNGWHHQCRKCDLKDNMNNLHIFYYERLLPEDVDSQFVVVYYLREPISLSCLREALYEFAKGTIDNVDSIASQELDQDYPWVTGSNLKKWNTARCNSVALTSTAKPWTNTHYSHQHINSHSSFVVSCGKNLAVAAEGKLLEPVNSWLWSTEKMCSVKLHHIRYMALQRFAPFWMHTENEVIAHKSEAHRDKKEAAANIPLNEFEALGRLRAGIHLQMERLIKCFDQRSISFDEEDPATIVMALLFQVGPNTETGRPSVSSVARNVMNFILSNGTEAGDRACRDAWRAICNQPDFVSDCACHAGAFVKDVGENWDKHNSLLVVVLFLRSVIMHVMNYKISGMEQSVSAVAKGLKLSRDIAKAWISKVGKAVEECKEESDRQTLISKVAAIGAIGTLTFIDHPSLMGGCEDVADFLGFRSAERDNLLVSNLKRHTWQRQHHIHSQVAAESVLKKVHKLLDKDSSALDLFLKQNWSTAQEAADGDQFQRNVWKRCRTYSASDSWYECQFKMPDARTCKLQIDALNGFFLINGKPSMRLPETITKHPLYERTFDGAVFTVQPNGRGGFSTRPDRLINGATFSFWEPDSKESFPTVEENRKGSKSILIPHTSFLSTSMRSGSQESLSNDDFPSSLIEDYGHWITLVNEGWNIHFRPKLYSDASFSKPATNGGSDYILNSNHCLVSLKDHRGSFLVDIQSYAHKHLWKGIFRRLSMHCDMHVFSNGSKDSVIAIVHLPRLGHHQFQVMKKNCSAPFNEVRSSNYNQRVAPNQNFGSLIGLKHGLLLSGSKHEDCVLLVPHGSVSKTVSAKINIKELRKPSFFKYEIRQDLRDIHPPPQRQATTYLAFLHGMTSGLFEDPFLECTGTKQALALLRSGRCCGNLTTSMGQDAVDTLMEEVSTLAEIALLSPRRTFYPPHLQVMEVVEWPNGLEQLCAHTAFAFLAHQRINDMKESLKLVCKTLPVTKHNNETIAERTGILSQRSLLKAIPLYPEDCILTREEFSPTALKRWMSGTSTTLDLPKGFGLNVRGSVQSIAMRRQGRIDSGLLKKLLQNRDITKLVVRYREREGDPDFMPVTQLANVICKNIGSANEDDGYAPLCDIWIPLYNIARKAFTSQERAKKFCFLIAFLAQRYPSYENELSQLLTVQKYGTSFSEPPSYSDYLKPWDDVFSEGTVESCIVNHLVRFNEPSPHYRASNSVHNSWRQRKDSHNRVLEDSKRHLIQVSRNAWSKRRKVSARELYHDKVSDKCKLEQELNNDLSRWKAAEELSNFVRSISSTLCKCSVSSTANAPETSAKLDRSSAEQYPNQFTISSSWKISGHLRQFESENLTNVMPNQELLGIIHGLKKNDGPASIPSFPLNCKQVEFQIEHQELISFFLSKLKQSWELAHGKRSNGVSESMEGILKVDSVQLRIQTFFEKELTKWKEKASLILHSIRQASQGSIVLGLAGLQTAKDIMSVLSRLLTENVSLNHGHNRILLEFGRAIMETQRARRCLYLLGQGTKQLSRLVRELENMCHHQWDVSKYPEWLLLQIDNNFCIREQQAEVALELMQASTNSCLQLNMGEGKTDVIIPMILSMQRGKRTIRNTFGNHKRAIARVTVLSSLYPTNSATWQWRLGGLLQQRIYPLLFQRDLNMGRSEATSMKKMLEYAHAHGHPLVTCPEHRHSLDNKIVELASPISLNGNKETSQAILEVKQFLNCNVRDYLDECDLILSPKWQLIYTLGSPQDMDGGQKRWAMAAAALHTVSDIANDLMTQFPDSVEVVCNEKPRFSAVRLLNHSDKAWEQIRSNVVNDVLSGRSSKHQEVCPRLLEDEKNDFLQLVLRKDIEASDIDLPEQLKKLALMLRGLLTKDALRFALTKRWRVNYGAHPERPNYLMAVPYRAKDVASDRTEYKHPDIMLLLTLLHYYQNGLREEQLFQVFQNLKNIPEGQAKTLFDGWADKSIKAEHSQSELVLDYSRVNLSDLAQFKLHLYPQFRYQMEVIDFFLFKKVFPVQAKQFPQEISSNSWDLCPQPGTGSDEAHFSTAGFSGTDDLQNLLPATTEHRELPSLKATNGIQLKNLIKVENDEVSMANSTKDILDILETNEAINVVLDPGALVLDFSNYEFAAEWLKLRPDKEAALFFDSRDRECVVCRSSLGTFIERKKSLYSDDLSKCLIYLDDVHCRGVNLLLPIDSRALLSLGRGMCKDKLLQAAMRLRQLGRGQSVHFVVSDEIRASLPSFGGISETKNVIGIVAWTILNSVKQICELYPYYLAQGAAHLHRIAAFRDLKEKGLHYLVEELVQTENFEVTKMYGAPCCLENLPKIARHHFRFFLNSEITQRIIRDVDKYAPNIKHLQSKFGQEMERELEQELEEEICIEKPGPAIPSMSRVAQGLLDLFQKKPLSLSDIHPLGKYVFSKTSLRTMEQFKSTPSSCEILVTTDFCKTITKTKANHDGHMKTPEWLVVLNGSKRSSKLVIISNYEAEWVASTIGPSRSFSYSGCDLTLLLFSPRRRLRQADGLLLRDLSLYNLLIKNHEVLHLYAGSTQVSDDSVVFKRMRLYLGLPDIKSKDFLNTGIQAKANRDGFVPQEFRVDPYVKNLAESEKKLFSQSPFQASPIALLLKLYRDIYSLGDELETTTLGRMIGVSELGGESD